jgi:hypothetical protein
LSAAFALLAFPAFADDMQCVNVYAPAITQPDGFAQQSIVLQKKNLTDVLAIYHRYELDLKDYRNCLTARTKEANLAKNKAIQNNSKNKESDIEKQNAILKQVDQLWNASVDQETKSVNEMTALAKIYCAHTTDPGICRRFKL